jgi:hypothetical protein
MGQIAYNSWQTLGGRTPLSLTDARLQAHYAVQLVSSVGFTYVEPRSDFSHTNMRWDHALGGLVSHPAPGHKPFRAGLRLGDLTLVLLDSSGMAVASLPLDGKTVDDGYEWLSSSISTYTTKPLEKPLFRPDHELPPHDILNGAAWNGEPRADFAELARWYGDADLVLQEFRSRTAGASPVRCWPHHFDIATLITVEAGAEVESSRTVGVGLSPGDSSYAEPYWYVTPWPYPKDPSLHSLPAEGHWHTQGWLGAVLTGSRNVAAGDATEQARRAGEFVEAAVAACQRLLG